MTTQHEIRGRRSEIGELHSRSTSPVDAPTLAELVEARFGRRDVLKGALAASALLASGCRGGPMLAPNASASGRQSDVPRFTFKELAANRGTDIAVAPGYSAQVFLPWGTPLLPDAPAFDPAAQSAEAQLQQVGYNHDFIGFIPLPLGSDSSHHGLLCINHEYTNEELMFPGDLGKQEYAKPPFRAMTRELVDIEMAAHGGTIAEVQRSGGQLALVEGSRFNRRISTLATEMRLAGPAAGSDRLKTSRDPSGTRVVGTVNNCAGGITPWGTYLMAEENFHAYFSGELPAGHREADNYARCGVPGHGYAWAKFHERFDVGKEPNEPNRFGWIVEVDALDPNSTPVKRTALGRFKHEGAESIVDSAGQVVLYCGDDERFAYLYKFVTRGRFDPDDRRANLELLDDGTLFVARFDASGTLSWLPLVFGSGPLIRENGFESQADVLVETRRAGELLGATPMDRPEDVEPNPVTGRVYVALTNNTKRKANEVDAANPRGPNPHGHIIELRPPNGDHTAETCEWNILLQCGIPSNPADQATFHPSTTSDGLFGDPDNLAVDPQGRLWVATDGNEPGKTFDRNDGIWALETDGDARATSRHFFSVPLGAEMCGPRFLPDGRTLLVSVQHPAQVSDGSSFSNPATRWPDFDDTLPPRPAVVVISRDDNDVVGS